MFDYLIVGAGFAGAVAAERLASCGKRILLVDRRNHIAGNAFDCQNPQGILVHQYGPHIFHTNSLPVFEYLSRFTAWRAYEHRVLAQVDSKLVPIPINRTTVNQLYRLNLQTDTEMESFLRSRAEPVTPVLTSRDAVVSKVGRDLYEKFFQNYTRKQWGKDPSELDAQVTARIPVRTNTDDRYFADTYQAMPKYGYTRLFENLLDHPNITIQLETDFRDLPRSVRYRDLIYTGPIDEYYGCRHGKLSYRSLRFEHETLPVEFHQPVAVINYPNEHDYTRVTEFKHLTGQSHRHTAVVYEYPAENGDPYYPVPTAQNSAAYHAYSQLAASTPHVHFLGRLGTYRYYNMDQVVAQALTLCKKLVVAPVPAKDGQAKLAAAVGAVSPAFGD